MINIPNKIEERIKTGIKKYQTILENSKTQDINETDTSRIISGILEEILGYDRFREISSEMNIKGTYCDLCIKIDNNVQILIEAKAVGIELKINHIKQAVDYGTNKGIDWVILSNGLIWQVYRLLFSKPISQELVLQIDFLNLSHKNPSDIEELYLISKEGFSKSKLENYYSQKQALSKYFLGAIILNDEILDKIKREVKQLSPEVKVTNKEISDVITKEVLNKELFENEKFAEAQKLINRMYQKREREKESQEEEVEKTENIPGREKKD